MENQLDSIHATLARSHRGIETGLHIATQGANDIAASWEIFAEADASDASELIDTNVGLRGAFDKTREAVELLPRVAAALNRYAMAMGLSPFEELSVSPAAIHEPQITDTPSTLDSTYTAGRTEPEATSHPIYAEERTAPESKLALASGPASSPDYDIIAVLGSAFNFRKKRFPKHVYKSLDDAMALYNQGKSADGIVLCGRGAIKDIEKGLVTAESEARLMQRYLLSQGVDPDAITLEEASVNTPENFLYFKRLAEINDWQRAYLPVAAGRVNRVALLAAKICYGQCHFDIRSVPCNTSFPDEPKLYGDQVCTLQEMNWGDDSYIVDEQTGTCKWDTMRKIHHACEYYVPSGQIQPGRNYHPTALMHRYGNPPDDAITIL